MEAEGIAMRPGPRPVIAPGVLPTLRRAILGMQLVVIRYAGPNTEEPATRILSPYGLLYGWRGWLVAHVRELGDHGMGASRVGHASRHWQQKRKLLAGEHKTAGQKSYDSAPDWGVGGVFFGNCSPCI